MNTFKLLAMRGCIPLLVALLGSLSGCSQGHAQATAAAAPAPVQTVIERAAPAESALQLPARSLPAEVARIHPRATGYIAERRVDLGDSVAAGAVLAVIDAPEIEQAVVQAEASVQRSLAERDLARLNFERARELVSSGAVSRAIHDERRAALAVAEAVVVEAQARLASAREARSHLQVRAPFAGVITARTVERGDRVVGDAAASTPPLFELTALDPLRVVVDVPQSLALQVSPGVPADVRFAELPDQTWTVAVQRSARRITEAAGGMRVELELPNPEGRLPAGMVGTVRLQVTPRAPVVLVPGTATLLRDGRAAVGVVDPEQRLRYVPVELGATRGNEVEVRAGLSAGTLVVRTPNALWNEGEPLVVQPSPAP